MDGNFTYIESTGVHDKLLRLRTNSVSFQINNNLGNYPIPGNNNSPNSEVDKIGTNNHTWTINGIVPLVSGALYEAGLGRLVDGGASIYATEISLSGLMTLALTGSTIWFYDEALTTRARIVSDALVITDSGCWVEVQGLNLGRQTDFINDSHEVGYVIPYTLTLVETKGVNE